MFSKTEKSYRYFDQESGCILHLPLNWEVHLNPGKDFTKWSWADSAWETGLFYYTYKDPELKRGILNLFKKVETKKGYYYQGHRFPGMGSEDMSRDQTILPLSALYHNGDKAELKEIASHLRYRLSKRYRMQNMWFWVKYLAGNKFAGKVFGVTQLIENTYSYLINKLVRKLTKIDKSYSPEETYELWYTRALEKYNANKRTPFHKEWFKRAQPMPAFAVHLSAWMVSCLEDGWIKRLNEKIIRWEAEESNYAIRMLTRDSSVPKAKLFEWKPSWGFRWQHRINTTCAIRFLGIGSQEKFLQLDGVERISDRRDVMFNAVDRDILFTLYKEMI